MGFHHLAITVLLAIGACQPSASDGGRDESRDEASHLREGTSAVPAQGDPQRQPCGCCNDEPSTVILTAYLEILRELRQVPSQAGSEPEHAGSSTAPSTVLPAGSDLANAFQDMAALVEKVDEGTMQSSQIGLATARRVALLARRANRGDLPLAREYVAEISALLARSLVQPCNSKETAPIQVALACSREHDWIWLEPESQLLDPYGNPSTHDSWGACIPIEAPANATEH